MRPPKPVLRNKIQLDTSESFYDEEFGWISRDKEPCKKCGKIAIAIFEQHGFKGCTHCLNVEPDEGVEFLTGGYDQARQALEVIFDERRAKKPIQPRFHPMYMRRDF